MWPSKPSSRDRSGSCVRARVCVCVLVVVGGCVVLCVRHLCVCVMYVCVLALTHEACECYALLCFSFVRAHSCTAILMQ